jgi:hypothetical protein
MKRAGTRARLFGLAGIGALAAAAFIPLFALAQLSGPFDVNNAGVFELDGDVTHEASTTPPYDWTNLFTSSGQRIQVANLVNSAFIPDPTTNDFAFISGSSKDNIDVGSWLCTTKPVTPKDEIQNSYAAAFIAPSTSPAAGDVLLYMALERGSVSGTSNAGFWIFKQPVACDPTTGTFINPTTGKTATHSDGDVLLFASFTSGGTTAAVQLFTWSTATGGLVGPTTGQDCATSTTNLCGISNAFSPISTPWAPGTVGTNGFFEAGIDLTKVLGSSVLSSSCFSTLLADTRSSASVTSDLHDFNSGNFSLCATPTVTTTASPSTGIVGSTSFSDSAKITGAVGSLAGETVTFNLYGPYSASQASALSSTFCTASPPPTPTFTSTGTLSAGSTAATWSASTSSSFTPTTTGTYYWVAFYPGDRSSGGLNQAANSGCKDEPITVSPASPTISTVATNPSSPIVVGTTVSISDTATLAGSFRPTGTVTFDLWGPTQTSCTGTPVATASSSVNSSTGTASSGSVSFSPTQVGTYFWTATYSGDSNNNPAGPSACGDPNEAVSVVKATPQLTTTIFLGDIANVSGGFGPTGSVTFNLFNNTTCTGSPIYSVTVQLSSGTANTVADLAANLSKVTTSGGTTYNWQVVYPGDTNNTSVTVGCGSSNGAAGSTSIEQAGITEN